MRTIIALSLIALAAACSSGTPFGTETRVQGQASPDLTLQQRADIARKVQRQNGSP